MNIYIIGVGLIGGSFALDIKATNPDTSIFGIDANPDNAIEAKKLGVIDEVADFDSISNADVVLVAVPVDASIKVRWL